MEKTQYSDIKDFIISQESQYNRPIELSENWPWSMKEHIRLSYLYKHSQLSTGGKEFKPVKNITRPILNLQYRSEGFDVKNITLYVDDKDHFYKSFIAKKFHERWAREYGLDTVIDQMVESYVDYGAALLKNVNDVKPEVVPLQSIAFCDQTDLLSGTIGIKHYYSPDQLLEMAKVGWGDESKGATGTLQSAIDLSRDEKRQDKDGTTTKTPGKYIEVYEIHGNMPAQFLDSTKEGYISQLQIVCLYQKKDSKEKGFITLFAMEEPESPFKLILRDAVFGRALGFGGAEELFDPQVWTNYDQIRMQDMLDAGSKIILKAIGVELKGKYPNGLKGMDNLEIVELGANEDLAQIDTVPRSMALFERSERDWGQHAQMLSSATDALMGEAPTSGTPFALQQLLTQQGQGLHDYRRGKLATFWEEVEREWILPYIAKELARDQSFLVELDLDELQYITEKIIDNVAFGYAKEKMFSGVLVTQEEIDEFKQKSTDEFRKKGNTHFIEVFKAEMKKIPLSVKVDVAGKQKNLAQSVDKLTNIFRFAFPNPQGFAATMQIPGMAKAFNQTLEQSGLSPVDFSGIEKLAMSTPQPSPMTELPTSVPANG